MGNAFEFAPPRAVAASDRRLLAVFDGGDAPGYASVAVALTEEGTRRGYEVWAAAEGFRSLTRDFASSPRFERLIVGRQERYALLAKGIPARSMGRRVLDAGSDFRSERYPGFLEQDRRREAAAIFRAEGFTHLVCVGGNGTLEGTKAMLEEFAERPPVAFVNVSIDDDLSGDRAIGFLSGVEAGATVARGLSEDAYTHKRIYILEMMGNRSGRHALHCGVAARAHLIVLPFFRFTAEVVEEIAHALARVDYALVVVAEGYEAERRKTMREATRDATGAPGPAISASELFKRQLEEAGLTDGKDGVGKRVIAEPYSRFLRGLRPSFIDVSAAYLKASLLFAAFDAGRMEAAPYVLASNDVGVRSLEEVSREDGVEPAFLPLLERLGLPRFQALVKERFLFRA
jgi:6-phosphofructokinase